MKAKTLISGMLLGCVIGTAFGLPTPEDRKKLCEQNPSKFVWVEKTQACIPINPCKSELQEINDSYCIIMPYNNPDNFEDVMRRYVKNVLHTDIVSQKKVPDPGHEYSRYTGCELQDGGYIVFTHGGAPMVSAFFEEVIHTACWAFGKNAKPSEVFPTNDDIRDGDCWGVESEGVCTDVADFASLLNNGVCTGKFKTVSDENVCHINCDTPPSAPGGYID